MRTAVSRHLGLPALVLVGLLAAACSGSGTPSNGVVTLGTASPGASGSADPSPGSSGGPSAGAADAYSQMLAYSQCMRSHGVPKFPDPVNENGNIGMRLQAGPGTGIDPQSPTYQAADAACKSLMPSPPPGGGNSTQAQEAFQQMLAYSQCIRDHGVKDFPDPVNEDGRISLQIRGGQGSDLDPNSPTFKAAQDACKSLQPGGPDGPKGGGTVDSTGGPSGPGASGQP